MAGVGEMRMPALRLRGRLQLHTVLMVLLLALVAFAVLYPLYQIVLQSFLVSNPGEPIRWGLSGWEAVIGVSAVQKAAVNTLTLTLVRQTIALVAAVFFAWLLARTDVPGARFFEFIFWLAFFLPNLTVTLSWILVLDSKFGLLNQLLRGFADGNGPFDIYSFWGIVWVHVMGTGIAIKVMILTPVFRNMDSSMEEAARVCGAGQVRTLARVFLPLMLPAIVAIELLAILRSLEAFEIEQILGTPIGLFVFSTWIYDSLNQPIPRFDAVAALAVVIVIAASCLIVLQRMLLSGRNVTTVGGQFKASLVRLGKWRWPAFGLLTLTTLVIIGVPLVFSVMGTFMKLFGFFLQDPWTLKHWHEALDDRHLGRALRNTAILAAGTAIVSVFLHSLIAYVIVRTRFFGRGAMDFLSWLPFTIPGIILSLALLAMFLQPALRPLYGTMTTLIVALVIAGMPFAVQTMKGTLQQLGKELEEAARVSGGSWWATYWRIVLPLVSPTLVIIGVISFIAAARDISQVALLSNASIRPLSILQLDYISEGKYEIAAVIATILLFVSLGLALLARIFGFRGIRAT